MHLPLSLLSSVCLRTSNGLSMGEFDKSLKCTIFGVILLHFMENCVLYVIIYTHFSFYAWVWFFYVFYRSLDFFVPFLTLVECILTPHGHPSHARGKKQEQKNVEPELTTNSPW